MPARLCGPPSVLPDADVMIFVTADVEVSDATGAFPLDSEG